MMRVLGIDPGSRITGYGLVDAVGTRLQYVASGCIRPKADEAYARLGQIFTGLSELIAMHRPQQIAIEQVFVARNPASALKLGQARGVAVAAAVANDLPVSEYAARRVKQAVTGVGVATKPQIQHMVKRLLSLDAEPASDAADALAIAICHINTQRPSRIEQPRA